jgi:hypothetical protein
VTQSKYYFGYGSNMLMARIRNRVPSATPITNASLPGYGLRFHKRSQDGSGKCNIISSDDETVYGVVFEVNPDELDTLDEAEQQGRRYWRRSVTVEGEGTSIEAFAYVADPFFVDDTLLPYEWYHAIVVAGAREHNLPSDYIAQIEAVRSYPDPNEERRRRYRSLLEEVGYPLLCS